MNAGRLPLFCDTALAERIERAEVGLIAGACEAARRRRPEAEGFAIPVAGGLAAFAEDGSPFNKVAGLGFGGVPGAAALVRSSGPSPPAARPRRSSWPTWPTLRSAPC
jgi:hypothetical protein